MARVQGSKENVRCVNKRHQTAFSKPKLWPKELDAAFGPHILFEQDGLGVLRMFFLPTMFLYDRLGIARGATALRMLIFGTPDAIQKLAHQLGERRVLKTFQLGDDGWL